MKRKDLPWLPALSLLLACAWNGNILAAEDAGDAGVSDLTRDIMMNGARKYDECLQQQTQAMFNDYEDVRRLTDQAMVNCRPALAELERNLKNQKLDPGLTAGYVRHVRDSSVRRLLPQLMAAKAQAGDSAAVTVPKPRR